MAEAPAEPNEDGVSPNWRVTLWAMVSVQLIMSLSFTILSPIMPLFLPEVGVTSITALDLWSGGLASVTSFIAAFAAPIWGRMSDIYGRKPMVLRAAFSIGVITILMGLAQSPWHLLGLRILMGGLAGFSSAAIVLVTTQVPAGKLGSSLGWMSTGQTVGNLIGPLIGGILADATGSYRQPFFVAGCVSLVSFVLCWFMVPERFTRPAEVKSRPSMLTGLRQLTRAPAMAALVMVLLLSQFGVQAIAPIVTIFIQEMIGSRPDLATLSGLAFSASGIAGVVAVPLLGRMSDRIGERKVLLIAIAGAALATAPQAFTDSYWVFVAERFGDGMFVGAIVPMTNTLIAKMTSPDSRGYTFGLTQSAYFLGNSFGPITGGAVGAAFGLHWVFLVTAAMLSAAVVAVAIYVPKRPVLFR